IKKGESIFVLYNMVVLAHYPQYRIVIATDVGVIVRYGNICALYKFATVAYSERPTAGKQFRFNDLVIQPCVFYGFGACGVFVYDLPQIVPCFFLYAKERVAPCMFVEIKVVS